MTSAKENLKELDFLNILKILDNKPKSFKIARLQNLVTLHD